MVMILIRGWECILWALRRCENTDRGPGTLACGNGCLWGARGPSSDIWSMAYGRASRLALGLRRTDSEGVCRRARGKLSAQWECLSLPATDKGASGSEFHIAGRVQAAWAALVRNAGEPIAQLTVNFSDHVSRLGSGTPLAWPLTFLLMSWY